MVTRFRDLSGHLNDILAFLETESFEKVGLRYGIQGGAIRRLLNHNGIDPKKYNKPHVTPKEFRDQRELAQAAERILESGISANPERAIREEYALYLLNNSAKSRDARVRSYEEFKQQRELR
jgi:hypothetical protein